MKKDISNIEFFQGLPTREDLVLWNIQSKKISNDQELIQQTPYPALKTKRKITKNIYWQQFTKGTHSKPNEQLFSRQVVIQIPKHVTHLIGEPKFKYGQQGQEKVRNRNRSTALERSVLKYWRLKAVLRYLKLALSFCYMIRIVNNIFVSLLTRFSFWTIFLKRQPNILM